MFAFWGYFRLSAFTSLYGDFTPTLFFAAECVIWLFADQFRRWGFGNSDPCAPYSIAERVSRQLAAICACEIGGGYSWRMGLFEYDVSTGRRISMCRIWAVFRNRRFARRLGGPPLKGVYEFPPYNPGLAGSGGNLSQ